MIPLSARQPPRLCLPNHPASGRRCPARLHTGARAGALRLQGSRARSVVRPCAGGARLLAAAVREFLQLSTRACSRAWPFSSGSLGDARPWSDTQALPGYTQGPDAPCARRRARVPALSAFYSGAQRGRAGARRLLHGMADDKQRALDPVDPAGRQRMQMLARQTLASVAEQAGAARRFDSAVLALRYLGTMDVHVVPAVFQARRILNPNPELPRLAASARASQRGAPVPARRRARTRTPERGACAPLAESGCHFTVGFLSAARRLACTSRVLAGAARAAGAAGAHARGGARGRAEAAGGRRGAPPARPPAPAARPVRPAGPRHGHRRARRLQAPVGAGRGHGHARAGRSGRRRRRARCAARLGAPGAGGAAAGCARDQGLG